MDNFAPEIKGRLTETLKTKSVELFKQGMSPARIGLEIGINKFTVRDYLKSQGYSRSNTEARILELAKKDKLGKYAMMF